jgi:hypothetical protein
VNHTTEYTHAVNAKFKQLVLNHPYTKKEGPIILSKFDKNIEKIKKLTQEHSYSLIFSYLLFLKPLSFQYQASQSSNLKSAISVPSSAIPSQTSISASLANANRISNNTVNKSSQQVTTLVNPRDELARIPLESVENVHPNTQPTNVLAGFANGIDMGKMTEMHWIAPDIERKLIIDLIYVLQVSLRHRCYCSCNQISNH